MQSYINTYASVKGEACFAKVFGYSTKGIPSIEIIGFKSKNKILKEKIIYLSKLFKLQLPLKRYVICLDGIESHQVECFNHFELPIFLLLLQLSEAIKLSNLQVSFSVGSFDVTGELSLEAIPAQLVEKIKDKFTLIGSFHVRPDQSLRVISFDYVLEQFR